MSITIEQTEQISFTEILPLAQAMHTESDYREFPFSWSVVRNMAYLAAEDPETFGYWQFRDSETNDPVGFALVYCDRLFFSQAKVVYDIAVYIKPEHRGSTVIPRWLKLLEAWAGARGAVSVRLGVTTGIQTHRTGRLYERLGMTEIGRLYERRL